MATLKVKVAGSFVTKPVKYKSGGSFAPRARRIWFGTDVEPHGVFDEDGQDSFGASRLAGAQIRQGQRLPALAASGACVAAKDVSMAGLIGSLAMLLVWSGLGATVDLAPLPRPSGVAVDAWLTCFPA